MSSAIAETPPVSRPRFAILALSLGTAMLVIDNAIANVALPTIARSLQISAASAVVIVTAYQVIMLMALLPLSSLGDRVGHRRMYQSGQAVFLVASLGSALATNLPMLLTARCFQALGVAAALSVSSALLRATYPPEKLGRGIALNGLIVAVAAAAAPSLGGLILGVASWRWVFATAAPFAVLSLLIGQALPDTKPRIIKFDMAGAALCAAMFGLLMSGLSLGAHGDWTLGLAMLAVGIPVALVFVRRELRSERPILPVDLLARATFAMPVGASLFAFSASVTFLVALPFRLQAAGVEPAMIGLILAAWPVAMMSSAPIAGLLADRAPKGLSGGIGMVLVATGMVFAGLAPADSGFLAFAVPMAFGGTGFGLFISPTSHLIVGSAPRARAAAAGALVSSTRFVGQALGAAMASALLTTALGTGPTPAFVASGLALTSAGFSLAILLRRGDQKPVASVKDIDAPP